MKVERCLSSNGPDCKSEARCSPTIADAIPALSTRLSYTNNSALVKRITHPVWHNLSMATAP